MWFLLFYHVGYGFCCFIMLAMVFVVLSCWLLLMWLLYLFEVDWEVEGGGTANCSKLARYVRIGRQQTTVSYSMAENS